MGAVERRDARFESVESVDRTPGRGRVARALCVDLVIYSTSLLYLLTCESVRRTGERRGPRTKPRRVQKARAGNSSLLQPDFSSARTRGEVFASLPDNSTNRTCRLLNPRLCTAPYPPLPPRSRRTSRRTAAMRWQRYEQSGEPEGAETGLTRGPQHSSEGDLWMVIDTAVYVSTSRDAPLVAELTRPLFPLRTSPSSSTCTLEERAFSSTWRARMPPRVSGGGRGWRGVGADDLWDPQLSSECTVRRSSSAVSHCGTLGSTTTFSCFGCEQTVATSSERLAARSPRWSSLLLELFLPSLTPSRDG